MGPARPRRKDALGSAGRVRTQEMTGTTLFVR